MTKRERAKLVRDLRKFQRHEEASQRRLRKAIKRLVKHG
jgi:hypothetical protein